MPCPCRACGQRPFAAPSGLPAISPTQGEIGSSDDGARPVAAAIGEALDDS